MSPAPWSLHLLSEVLAAFTVGSPNALRDVVSRVAEAVDAEVTAILRGERILLCTGLNREEQQQLIAARPQRQGELDLAVGQLHLFWVPLDGDELLVVGRFREAYDLEERALLRAMGRSIQLSTQVLAAVKAEQEAMRAEKQAKEAAIREATIDHLTGLPNRRLVLRQLAERLSCGRSRSGIPAVLFIDLDRFKQINDAHGHRVGDRYLQEVGRLLRDLIRSDDLVGRLSGDEFVVLTTTSGLQEAGDLAGRILWHMHHQPLRVGGRRLPSSASIGIALATADDTPETLLENADLAMYSIKERRAGGYACFDQTMRQQVRERARLEAELREGLPRGQVLAHFQPIVSAAHGGVVGFEALARWQHPRHGLLSPERFIGVAEEAGLLRELDTVVMESACRQIGRWSSAREGILPRLSINIAATSLADPMLSERIRAMLADSPLESRQLFLEITETTLVEDVASSFRNINELKRQGVRLAIDDFGTGYSSLRYLKRFPVGILKIDRSFVDGLGHDSEDDVIVETVIRMARSLGIEVVAEGVETQSQAGILRRLGCHYLQGYLYGHPAGSACSEALYHQSLAGLIGTAIDAG
ncbi:MAG: bifunctional diguanylate cyclase/phosphodiesterase [Synechococcaceae cyanobacterium]|nr:bifunctional diguanylate cyclase/phosphodiesterase [Synechococcaceae cyanobacterium]